MEQLLLWIVPGAVLVLAFVYLCARVASYGYFRTKLEYLKQSLRMVGGLHGEE